MNAISRICLVLSIGGVIAGCAGTQTPPSVDQRAVALVASALSGNKLGVTSGDLLTKANPRGEGTFVYHPTTRFSGVERYLLWLVVDGRAYALNGASKGITPTLSWPREAEDAVWSRTGLDKYSATEAVGLVFTEGTK